MENRQPEELTLRQYLLGRLDPAAETTERLEERILMDNDLAELLGVLEDEIIEDYLEGVLDREEREAVEKHFLRPRERQKKLKLARVINRTLESSVRERSAIDPAAAALQQMSKAFSFGWWSPKKRIWVELAACLLLVLAGTYAFKARREIEAIRSETGRQLAAQRDRSKELERQLQDLRQLTQPATVILTLLHPGVPRGDVPVPTLQLGSGTQRIHVEVAVPAAPPGTVDVRLENTAGTTVWTASRQPLFWSGDSALLILDVPAQGLQAEDYRLVVGPPTGAGGGVAYAFRVSKK